MAHLETVKILKKGSWDWNIWREANPQVHIDLRSADLSGLNLSKMNFGGPVVFGGTLTGAALDWADLERVNLQGALLWDASLQSALLKDSDLTGAAFLDANLEEANLSNSRLISTNFFRANLRNCNLSAVFIYGAHLEKADISGAKLLFTTLADIDLTQPVGLEEVVHWGPSEISVSTLELTAKALEKNLARREAVEVFYRAAGVPEDVIDLYRARIGSPPRFYGCFISYSHCDKRFCQRLYADLQAQGVRCWLDEKDLSLGDRILDAVAEAIRGAEKILLCCSRSSLQSWWVKDELRKAQNLERRERRSMIIPLNIDGFLFEWEDGLAADITSRLAADFTDWEIDETKYWEQLGKLLAALQTNASGEREAAEPRHCSGQLRCR